MTKLSARSGRFDVNAIAAALPATASTMLVDTYLSDKPVASVRVFRAYRPVPAHFHRTCDEYLFVLSGRGTFWIEDAASEAEFGPGTLLCFEKTMVHAIPKIHTEPLVVLSIDTPRRDPGDIVFVNPEDGTAETFMARNAKKPPPPTSAACCGGELLFEGAWGARGFAF